MVVVNAFHVTGRQLFSSPVSRLLSVVRDYSARAGLALATDNGTRTAIQPLMAFFRLLCGSLAPRLAEKSLAAIG